MKRFKRAEDRLGNYYVIFVNDEGRVTMSNQSGVACSLASVYNGVASHEVACARVASAAEAGIAALKNISQYDWTELPPSASDLSEDQTAMIRSAVTELVNGIAEDLELSSAQAPSAKALLESLLRKQPLNNFVL